MGDTHQPSIKRTSIALPPFEVLFARYEKGIYNLIYRMVDDVEEATDLTSQTFLHALRAYNRFRGESQAYTWLYRIAVNLCKNYFRRRDRESRWQLVSLDTPIYIDGEEVERNIEDTSHSPAQVIEGRELQSLIQQELMCLSPDLRMVILLRDVQGLSYQEIAAITECSMEAVKSRIFRARGYLRKSLSPYLHSVNDEGAEQALVESSQGRHE